MKKFLILILTLFISTAVNADELKNVLNKVYDKGSKSAETYISNFLDGPGETEVSITTKNENKPTGSIMVVRPYSIDENSLTFYQAQLNSFALFGDTRQSLNYGVGKRFLSDDKTNFWGINSFIDYDTKANVRGSIGYELKFSAFEATANYYMGITGDNAVGDTTERILEGQEFKLAGQVPYAPWANINYTNYTWGKELNSDDSQGKVYSGEVFLSNNLTLEFGYDDNNISDSMDYARLTYVYSGRERPTVADGLSAEAFKNSDVSEDMLTKVKRSNIITLEVETSGVVISNGNS
jgi:hypothetical protein